MSEPIQLASPDVGPEEERLVLEVLRSGRLSLGPMLERFERAFADWLGVEDAVAVSSGTAGLHLGVRALGWGEGDEVLTSPFTFVATANSLLYEGARPAFCDIDPDTFDITPETAAAAIGPRTAGILPVDIFGYPADLAGFERLAAERGIGLLEDSCQALGAIDGEGRKVGSRGVASVFAFYANKQMTTGEGGMVIPPDAGTAARLRSERNQGRAMDMDWLDHDRLGYNYRLSDVASAIGLAQVGRLDSLLEARARVAALYREALSGIEGLRLPLADRGRERRGWFVYVVQVPPGADRDEAIRRLAEEGIASKAYLPCAHLMPHIAALGFEPGRFPVAEDVSARSMALPFHHRIGEAEVERVAAALAAVLG